MPVFYITFTKTIEATVEAESLEALLEVASEMSDYELRDWGSNDWEVTAYPVEGFRRQSGEHAAGDDRPDCGLINKEILEYSDYLKEKSK